LKKWKKTSKAFFFILSNKNIQIFFEDKSQIIFYCLKKEKKIKYIDEKGNCQKFIGKNNVFPEITCNDLKIRNKINYSINEILN
jgi:hypothetical protein